MSKKKKELFVGRIMISGKKFKKSFSSKKAKEKWLEHMREVRAVYKDGNKKNLKITFNDLCEKFLETRIGTRKGTMRTYKSAINTHFKKALGEILVTEIEELDAMKLLSKMEKDKYAPRSINKHLVILKSIMKFAVRSKFIEANPFSEIKPLKVDNTKFYYWTQKEAALFLNAVKDHHLAPLFKFALLTGLRRGEICGLQWKNVVDNLGVMELHFNEQLLAGRERGLVKGGTMRFIPLTKDAIEILNNLGPGEPNEYIFKMKNLLPVEPNYLSTEFKRIQQRAGIDNVIVFHGTRHSFASLLTAKGVNIQKVSHLLGHKDTKVTERYSHLSRDDLRESMKVVNFN